MRPTFAIVASHGRCSRFGHHNSPTIAPTGEPSNPSARRRFRAFTTPMNDEVVSIRTCTALTPSLSAFGAWSNERVFGRPLGDPLTNTRLR